MGEFFGALSTFFQKLETFATYMSERITPLYQGLSSSQKALVFALILMVVLVGVYLFALLQRFAFKFSTRKLKNIRREYQITLNRAEGKRCNFIWDILLYQKIVILDDPLLETIVDPEEQQKLLTV